LRINVLNAEASFGDKLFGIPPGKPPDVRSVEDSLVIARPPLLVEHPLHCPPVQDVRKADDSEAAGTNPPSCGSKRPPGIDEVFEYVSGDEAVKGRLVRLLARDEALS